MKRLLSWLLVLVMVIGLLPMSAFAATDVDWEVNDEDMDIIVDFGGELNPIDLTEDLSADKTATVTVPAGKIYYFIAYNVRNGMEMAITGLDPVICSVAPGAAYTWSIDNSNGEADAEYDITIGFPEGHMENPKVIEEMSWYSDEVTQAAGDNDGFFYTYTAVADGVVTLYFYPEYDDEGNVIEGSERDIMVTNTNTGVQYSLLIDGVDNYGKELQIPVAAGDVLSINTAYVADAAGNAYPAATYSWTGNFAYPAGSEQNPIVIEWVWDEAYANATASVTTEADGTYYVGYAGMILTVDGNVVEMDEAGNFVLSAGEHNLALATPVGAQANPEVIENIDGYSDTNSLAADGAYYYIWTATEDGTVTLDVTSGANLTVDKLTYSEDSEWPISTQYVLAEPEIDENWNYTGWTVAENLVIDVVAGEQLKIQVNALTDWSTWTTPAIDYTLTGEFEGAVVAPEYVVAVSGITLDMAAELFVSAKYLIPAELLADENATFTVEFKGDVTEYNLKALVEELGLDSKGRLVVKQPIPSPYMDKKVNVTIKDGNGFAADYTYSGASYEGEFSYGIKEYMDLAFAQGDNYKTTKDAIAALLTYGSYAQTYFKAKGLANISETPVSDMLTEYGYSPVDISAFSTDLITQATISSGDLGVSFRTATPALDAAVYMTVQINNDSGYALEDLTFSLTYYDASVKKEVTVELEDVIVNAKGRFELKIENIAAAMFDYMYKITVTNASGESYTAQYSINAYVKELVTAYEGNASKVNDLNLYKAMYYYNQAANALFE